MNKGKSKDFPFFVVGGGDWDWGKIVLDNLIKLSLLWRYEISLFGIKETFGEWGYVSNEGLTRQFFYFPKTPPAHLFYYIRIHERDSCVVCTKIFCVFVHFAISKKNKKIFQKPIDKCVFLWYNVDTTRENTLSETKTKIHKREVHTNGT